MSAPHASPMPWWKRFPATFNHWFMNLFNLSAESERALRRTFGLLFLGLTALLSTWAWTLENANYTPALQDVLRGKIEATAALDAPISWAGWFYVVDTVLYIACYLVFAVLIARQLHRLLGEDCGTAAHAYQSRVRNAVAFLVRAYTKLFLLLAVLILSGLVVFDVIENISAWTILWSDAASPKASAVYDFCASLKKWLGLATFVWICVGAFIWIAGYAIPKTDEIRERELSKVRLQIREGLNDVLVRTRYCVLFVVVYVVLLLGIDQAQDVLGAQTALLSGNWRVIAWVLIAIAFSMFALHAFSHALWVWVRLLVRIRRPQAPDTAAGGPIATFSRWWGRLLGAAPWFVMLVLCVRTAGSAIQVADYASAWMLLITGALAAIVGITFMVRKEFERKKRESKDAGHRQDYANADDEKTILYDPAYKFLGILKKSPVYLPLIAVAGILVVRALYIWDDSAVISHALTGITFAMALWTCVVNRLALNSLRSRLPWVTLLLLLFVVLAALGLTQNHFVLAGEAAARTSTGMSALKHMMWMSFFLTLFAGFAYWCWTRFLIRGQASRKMRVAWCVILALITAALVVGSYGQKGPAQLLASNVTDREPIERAVAAWLRKRIEACANESCNTIPIYLVSAEGGGIRAAYYSARLLGELSARPELQLPTRVFSLSGVSGGSLGVMSWRQCLTVDPGNIANCVRPLGRQDLLTPLASVWLYEDALALLLPTGKCKVPGCGFLDRASWFERSLEVAMPAFSEPLPTTAPYVFLNSTWVETGERSIASNVLIESPACVKARQDAVRSHRFDPKTFKDCESRFPTARDQLLELGKPARASTLAHNSARFPYFNPIGYIDEQGHLADGGYFDNSGQQTTADILNEFTRQLTCKSNGCLLTTDEIKTFREKVSFTALMIRNGVRDNADPAESNCSFPRPKSEQNLFGNAVGPLITAINSTGVGTQNRVAQCNLQRALITLRSLLDRQQRDGGYFDIRLVNDGTLYPLGWYLSPSARKGIDEAASKCVKETELVKSLLNEATEGGEFSGTPCFERVSTPHLTEESAPAPPDAPLP